MTKRPALFVSTLLLAGFFTSHSATDCLGASSQFELDLKDLQKEVPTVRSPKRAAGQAGSRKRKHLPETDAQGYTRYTIKPGDFLFKVLIREFGLSNSAAESLLPEIQRINHLADIRRLEVGQTVLIPLKHPKAEPGHPARPEVTNEPLAPPAARSGAQPAPPEPVPPAIPRQHLPAQVPSRPEQVAPAATPPPVPSAPAPEQPTAQQPLASEPSFADRLTTVWAELVPSQGRLEPISLNGKALPPERFPLLLAADGGKVLVDLGGRLSAQEKNQLATKYPDTRVVARGKESTKDFFATLLRTAEFAKLESNVTVSFGTDPRLSVLFDFRVSTLPATTRGPEAVYLCIDDDRPSLPPPLKEFLARNGYRVVELSTGSAKAPTEPGYDFRTILPGPPCNMAAELLDALSIHLDKNRIVSGTLTDSRFSIRVEGYFETAGKRYIVSCDDSDSYNYTLLRLLQLDGYTIVHFTPDSTFNATAAALLTALNYPYAEGSLTFTYDRYSITVSGFKVTRKGPSPGRVVITARSADPLFAELLKWQPNGP